MKAVLVTKYGGLEVLKVKEVPTPSPKDSDVLIKIHATAVNNTDPTFRKGKPFISRLFTGLIKPKHAIPGDVLAGEIVEIGSNVTRFKKGDRVYGYSTENLGAHAEYICLPENAAIIEIPDSVSYEEAAGIVDGGHTALEFLKDTGLIKENQKVLIYGASGSVGTAAVQIAAVFGAKVTGVCSGSNIEMVESLGADRVIDYTTTNFTHEQKQYDIIFDAVAKLSFSQCKNALTENGIYLTTFPAPGVLLKEVFQSKKKGKRAFFCAAGIKPAEKKIENLQFLSKQLTKSTIKTCISIRYTMDDIREAHTLVESGHKKGNVIINVL